MKKFLLLSALAVSSLAEAQVTPKVQPETLVNGKSYILVNKAQNASQYMSRTSWDGALYFLGESDSNYANHAVTATENGDGTWTFSQSGTSGDGEAVTNYLWIPSGSDNVNLNGEEPATWKVTKSTYPGFYQLEAVEGFGNYACVGRKMHLNSGSQYVVISQPSSSWYPDFAGGAVIDYDEATGDEILIVNDSTSFNWGFVQLENIPAYYQDLKAVATINDLYNNYCSIEGYEDGFTATYKVCADIYNSADFSEDDIESIKTMANGKINLYKEIENAYQVNNDDNAVLLAAISTAKASFDKVTSASDVENAVKTLQEAVSNYLKGNGDVTSLGQNMSFEDLSAQGGAQSSSVAGAPTGWNIYINGKQVVTVDDVKAAGMNAWHGVNNDCAGEVKDGDMGFGIWNGSIPQYELSQTITGLENGTYEITAGLMAGSNGSGSRLTTQRIFGNLNSTYYGSDFDYDASQLDKSEVYTFMGNEILTTDRDMLPVTVQAFVYDGTLTFGVRTDGNYRANNRTSNNGAGGDGWFKVDNFKITNKGYIAEDAINIFSYYADMLGELAGEKMSNATQEKLEKANLGNITESTPQAEIINAILTAKDLIVEVESSVKSYQKLIDAVETHYNYLDQYSYKAGANEYADVISEAENAYYDAELNTEEEIDALITRLENALQDCIQSDTIEEGADLTEYIKNASFEDLSAQNNNNSNGVENVPTGWSLYVNGEASQRVTGAGWAAINSGDNLDITDSKGESVTRQYTDGEHLWGVWSGAIPVLELSQTIKGLPAGAYTLTADIVVQNDWAGMNLTNQRLFANDYVTLFGATDDYIQNLDEELHATFPEDVLVAEEIDAKNPDAEVKHLNYAGNYVSENYGASGAPYTTTVVFGLAKAGDVKIGFRTSRVSAVTGQVEEQASLGWFKLDNFRLTYDSAEVPAGADATADTTPINNVNGSNKTAVDFYSLSGVRLAAPQKGINIVKMSNGTTSKVFVK